MIPTRRYAKFLDQTAWAGAVAVLVVAIAVLAGWVASVSVLKTVLPGLASMNVNTAISFVAAAISLLLMQNAPPGSPSRHLARALSILLAVLGALTLAEDLFGLDFRIDQLVMRDPIADTSTPGRMAPITAVNFAFTGFALLALKSKHSRIAWCGDWFATVPMFLSALALIGYAYGVSSLYKVGPYSSMALHTAIGFFVLSLSLFAANPT